MSLIQNDIDLSNRDKLLDLIQIYKDKQNVEIVELLKDLELLSTQNDMLSETVEYYSNIINTFETIKSQELQKLQNILEELKQIKPASDLQQRQLQQQLNDINNKLQRIQNLNKV